MFTVVSGDGSGYEDGKGVSPSLIDEIVREGARRMLAEALRDSPDIPNLLSPYLRWVRA